MSDLEARLREQLPDIAAGVNVDTAGPRGGGRGATQRWVSALIVVLVIALAGGAAWSRRDTGGANGPRPGTQVVVDGSTTTAPSSVAPTRGKLEVRPVRYSGSSPLIFLVTGNGSSTTCVASGEDVALFDRKHEYCYVLGPAVLTDADIDSASAEYDSTTSQWATNVHWANDRFITEVARPFVNEEIAFVLDGVVQSAPTVNPGITGRDVEITGGFTRAEAIRIAASITGIPESEVRVEGP